jgi:hypothetical protein
MKHVLLLGALAGLTAAPALAQEPRFQGRLDPVVVAAVEAQLDSARAARLPADPLIRKALEGRTKGADGNRIVAAVRALRLALADARGLLGDAAQDAEVVSGANALRAGIPARHLVSMRRERDGALNVPLDIMTDLVARGVKPAEAATAVERLVRQGRNDADLVRLRDQIDQDVRTGLAPQAALDRRLAGVPAAGPPRP